MSMSFQSVGRITYSNSGEGHATQPRSSAGAGRTAVNAGRNHGVEKEAVHAGIAPQRGFPKGRLPKGAFFGSHHPLSLGRLTERRYPELAVKVRWGALFSRTVPS